MIVAGFSNVWCSAFYILAILMLFSHLRHGVQSIFQTVEMCIRDRDEDVAEPEEDNTPATAGNVLSPNPEDLLPPN